MTYRADYEGIGKMLCAPYMVGAMHVRAEAVAERARAIAPKRSGHYSRSFRVSSGVREGKTRRAYGRVTNTASYAIEIEYGTENTPAHRTLRTALDVVKGTR
jgi:hypothetical protein